ncbi:MBL fold metallo-hydrolase [Zafaria sp. Z1313]|uniref:MBL fold metallo-hydrolase n=1 Tax=unclassified Zafaria TaxID=2828765 RepID=UPI002E75E965|nr:MBL fold metallo-hydrolase [Zafaria sp. J156]MEE1620189.1 MBL fold metallo-hydrolase [Zafaria sp. J156]
MSENTGSPTLLHSLRDVVVRRLAVGAMDNNCYLLTHRRTGAQVLVDAAADAPALLGLLREGAADAEGDAGLALIVTTHRHADHIGALAALAEATGARLAAGSGDAEAIEMATGVRIDVRLDHGDVGRFDGFELTAVHLRGHTPGSVALVYEDPAGPAHLFTGDSLFPGGVGNTQQDPERFASLLADVSERLFGAYPDDSLVHPGHGRGTTLGAERPHVPEWAARGW